MFGRSTAGFDRLVEKATSQLLLEPDWDSILQICDSIRQGDVQPKYAVQAIRRKIYNENPHVSMFALQCLESSVKNCGQLVHNEVATKDFMEFFKDLVKVRNDPVRGKILEMVQIWSHAFRNEPSYKVVQDTFHLMKMEGYPFPQLKEADAMFSAEKAPEWKDGDCCHRCRVQFTMVQRKHHCRNCGQVFCGKCSSKNSIIPKYGIEREVRVCEACFDTLSKIVEGAGGKKESEDDLPAEYLASPLSRQSQTAPSRSEQELQEEEELQLALALSKSEAENKDKDRGKRTNYSLYGNTTASETSSTTEPTYAPIQPAQVTAPVIDTSDMDPELARYLNRNYWQQKHEEIKTTTTQPSAPAAASDTKTATSGSTTTERVAETYQNGEVTQTQSDQEEFLNALRSSIEIFVNRMKSNSLRGRSIANDSSVQTLFMTINQMHPQLMKYMGEQEDARAHYEGLQDKLAQMKDAREALDALRDEHREKRRREMEELERQRQIQMAHKLEIMRQKKQEYLEYQRQLALQRMQEQEREMQIRLEQQKHMAQMRAMQQYYPQVYGQPVPGQPMPGYSPAGSTEGSPLHHPHPTPMAGPYPQPGMGAAPGQPVAPAPGAPQTQATPAGAQPPGAASGAPQSMYAGYNQGTMGQPPASFQGPPQAGYQPPPGPGSVGAFPPGQFQPPASTQPPHTQQGPPPPQGYTAAGPTQTVPGMEYSPYNMQSMAGALPPQGQPQGQPQFSQPGGPPQPAPQPGSQPGGPAQGQQYMGPPPQSQYPQPPGPGGSMPPGVPPTDGQPPQQILDAQLISFD